MNTQRSSEATLLTSGVISASVAWGVDEQGRILVPPVTECRIQRYRSVGLIVGFVFYSEHYLLIHLSGSSYTTSVEHTSHTTDI